MHDDPILRAVLLMAVAGPANRLFSMSLIAESSS
jgi:hypothetical protein